MLWAVIAPQKRMSPTFRGINILIPLLKPAQLALLRLRYGGAKTLETGGII